MDAALPLWKFADKVCPEALTLPRLRPGAPAVLQDMAQLSVVAYCRRRHQVPWCVAAPLLQWDAPAMMRRCKECVASNVNDMYSTPRSPVHSTRPSLLLLTIAKEMKLTESVDKCLKALVETPGWLKSEAWWTDLDQELVKQLSCALEAYISKLQDPYRVKRLRA